MKFRGIFKPLDMAAELGSLVLFKKGKRNALSKHRTTSFSLVTEVPVTPKSVSESNSYRVRCNVLTVLDILTRDIDSIQVGTFSPNFSLI